MFRFSHAALALAVLATAWSASATNAQDYRYNQGQYNVRYAPQYGVVPVAGTQPARLPQTAAQPISAASNNAAQQPPMYGIAPSQGHYPVLNAPMYPCPRPNVPYQVGGTVITNQAFYPQEMLYPHEYHAIYPPFYYKVKGHWVVTPLGVWSADHWKLLGTEVRVKYKSNRSVLRKMTDPILGHF